MTYLLLYPCRLLRLYPSSLTSARLQAVPKLQVYFVLASRRMLKLGSGGTGAVSGSRRATSPWRRSVESNALAWRAFLGRDRIHKRAALRAYERVTDKGG